MVYGYARVSSKDQSLASQVKQLKEYGCEKIFKEKVSGRRKEDRKEFVKLLDIVKSGDTLVVTKLDRFARSLKDALNTASELQEKGVTLVILNVGQIDNTPTGRLFFHILSAVAEFEADMIRERQREGIEEAKKRGVYKGRPLTYTEKHAGLQQALEWFFNRDKCKKTVDEICEITKISKSTLYRAARRKKYERTE